MPEGYQADMANLLYVATTSLPDIATSLRDGQHALDSIQADHTKAFEDSSVQADFGWRGRYSTGGGLYKDLQGSMEALHQDLGTAISRLAGNIDESATALHSVHDRYLAADGQ